MERHGGPKCNYSYIPTAEEYSKALGSYGTTILVVGGLVTLGLYILFFDQFFYTHANANRVFRRHICWIVSVFPLMSLMSLVALVNPRGNYICQAVKVTYMSIGMSHFTDLTLLMFGSEEVLLAQSQGRRLHLRRGPVCCCCFCLPNPVVSKFSLRTVLLLADQLPFTQAAYYLVVLLLLSADNITLGSVNPAGAYVWLNVFNVASFMSGVYSLQLLSYFARGHLEHYRYRLKSLTMTLLVMVTNLQALALDIMGNYDAFPCVPPFLPPQVYKMTVENSLFIMEMMVLGVLTVWQFRNQQFLDQNPVTVDEWRRQQRSRQALRSASSSSSSSSRRPQPSSRNSSNSSMTSRTTELSIVESHFIDGWGYPRRADSDAPITTTITTSINDILNDQSPAVNKSGNEGGVDEVDNSDRSKSSLYKHSKKHRRVGNEGKKQNKEQNNQDSSRQQNSSSDSSSSRGDTREQGVTGQQEPDTGQMRGRGGRTGDVWVSGDVVLGAAAGGQAGLTAILVQQPGASHPTLLYVDDLTPFLTPQSVLHHLNVPQTSVPQTGVPQTGVPQTSVLQVSVPHANIPQASVAQANILQVSVPQATVPKTSVLQASIPQVSVPQASIPETSVPQANIPQAGVPQTVVHQSVTHQTHRPSSWQAHTEAPADQQHLQPRETDTTTPAPQPHTPQPHTPQPHTPQTHTPQPHTTQPHTPQPHIPQLHTPQPDAPQPHTLQPHTPQPDTPQPDAPQPHTLQPHTPQPHTPQPYTPQPHTLQPHTLQSHTPQPHATQFPAPPQPHTSQPHTLQPHAPQSYRSQPHAPQVPTPHASLMAAPGESEA